MLEQRDILLLDEWAADQDPLYRRVFYRELLPHLTDAAEVQNGFRDLPEAERAAAVKELLATEIEVSSRITWEDVEHVADVTGEMLVGLGPLFLEKPEEDS